ncbi:hypothetical protein BV378_07670 [Nostoc sp. RF31YmG]|nr:hypothetical protein BV378_07670 [Nostoc sp. RF31YmG]
MPNKFIRIQKTADFEVAINLDNISYVEKSEDAVFIFFLGQPVPKCLEGEIAEAFWRGLGGQWLTIHRAAHQEKIAEVPPRQDSSD